jgi:hypothetical protein
VKRILGILALAASLHAAGTVQQSFSQIGTSGSYALQVNWTGDASNGTVPATAAVLGSIVQGYRVISVSVAPGSPAPSNNYSLTLTDFSGVDILSGSGAGLSSTTPSSISASPSAPPIYGTLNINITATSVVNAKGLIMVYLAPLSQVYGLTPTAPSFSSQGPNLFLASPNGSSGAPNFRTMVAADVPNPLNQNTTGTASNITGLLAPVNGGTGVASPTTHCVLVAQGASASHVVCPSSSGQVLTDLGAGSDPAFQVLPAGNPVATGPFQFIRSGPTGAWPDQRSAIPGYQSSDYNFAAQSPAGTLTSGVPATVTLTPCPLGVAGADSLHYLEIAGTGVSEAVLITSGTCTSGSASGNVVFTPANNHTAGWTISSASAGIQEAINVGGTYAPVHVPGIGTSSCYSVYAPINANSLPFIYGDGPGSTCIQKAFASGDVFLFQPSAPTAFYGLKGVLFEVAAGITDSAGYMVHTKGANYGIIQDVMVYRVSAGREPFGGIYLEDSLSVYVSKVLMVGMGNTGFKMGNAGQCTAKVTDMEIGSFGTSANLVVISGQIQSTTFQNLYLQGGNNNIAITVPSTGYFNEINFSDLTLDSASGAAVNASTGAGGTSQKVSFSNVVLGSLAFGINVDGTGGTFYNWTFSGVRGGSNVATGLGVMYFKNVSAVTVTNSHLQGATSAAGDNGLYFDGTTANVQIVGNQIGFAATGATGAGQSNNGIVINSGTHTNMTIENNALNGATSPLTVAGGTLVTPLIRDNLGIDNVLPVVASAATMAIPFNPLFTVSGTTGVTAVSGCYVGQRGTFTTTSGAVAFTAGATIGASLTTTQNVPVVYYCDGTKIWLK